MKVETGNALSKIKQNSIILTIGNVGKYEKCSTHFGGVPDVPADFVWPIYMDDKLEEPYPINFLAQINCENAAKYDTEGLLPERGLLSFFYDAEGQPWEGMNKDNDCIRVFWFEDIETLVPAELSDDFDETICYPYLSIGMKSKSSYPGYEDYSLLKNTYEGNMKVYHEVLNLISCKKEEEVSKLLGWADVIQATMLRDCDRNFFDTKRDDSAIVNEWQLLFQLSTIRNKNFELMFGDCGSIYFYIRKTDLLNHNFDNVYMQLQCG